MNTYVLESLENGSHGIIPNEGINYFVGQNRITIHKDGKKVLDKEIDVNPDGSIIKYNLICDDDKDPELEPVKDVEEYNVANMLPQVMPDGAVLRKEECEEIVITDEDLMTEAVSETALAVLFGGTVVATFAAGIGVIIKDMKDTKDSINWYADQNNVKPRFEDLKKKTYKVKFNSKDHNFDLTTKEKKWWDYLDQYNAADIYFYDDKRAFGVIYGCHDRDISYNGDYTTYRIRIRVVIYNAEFKKHIEYYTAKAMVKHGVVSPDINDWIVGVKQDYKEWKKAQKKIKKDTNTVADSINESKFDFSSDLDAVLETCDNILERIKSYKEATEPIEEIIDETITESADDTLTEKAVPIDAVKAGKKIVDEVEKIPSEVLNKISKLASDKGDLLDKLKDETDKLKKNDIKKKLIKNQKEFRKLLKGRSAKNKDKLNKFYSSINIGHTNQSHIDRFMDQMRRDNETALRAHRDAMHMHQMHMDMHHQAVQNHMMMNGMM